MLDSVSERRLSQLEQKGNLSCVDIDRAEVVAIQIEYT